MATWESTRKWKYNECTDGYTPGEVSWEYQTTADVMTLLFSEEAGYSWGGDIPAKQYKEYYASSRCEAVLRALIDWDKKYNNGQIGNGA